MFPLPCPRTGCVGATEAGSGWRRQGVWYERADGERRLIGAAWDITARLESAAARRELEEQVRRTQKLESLGALTGGIAHDFNNLLTPVLGAASLLLQELPEDSRYRRRVETIQQAARRAADLTGQMLSYAGGTDLELRPVEVSDLVREMQLLLESSVSREARLQCRLEEALPRVLADPGQLSQVIVNLIVNASEALGASGRNIELHTESVEADRSLLDACVLGEQCEAGRYVALEVRDDGEGIAAEAVERIFDPFFTTKFTGRGLGLAMVVGIVRGHGGALQVESAPGLGTTFRILLPVASRTAAAPAGIAETDAETTAPWTPSGVFLVVDDDEGARDFVATLLERSGIEVQMAGDGNNSLTAELFSSESTTVSHQHCSPLHPQQSHRSTVFLCIHNSLKVSTVLLCIHKRRTALFSSASITVSQSALFSSASTRVSQQNCSPLHSQQSHSQHCSPLHPQQSYSTVLLCIYNSLTAALFSSASTTVSQHHCSPLHP